MNFFESDMRNCKEAEEILIFSDPLRKTLPATGPI